MSKPVPQVQCLDCPEMFHTSYSMRKHFNDKHYLGAPVEAQEAKTANYMHVLPGSFRCVECGINGKHGKCSDAGCECPCNSAPQPEATATELDKIIDMLLPDTPTGVREPAVMDALIAHSTRLKASAKENLMRWHHRESAKEREAGYDYGYEAGDADRIELTTHEMEGAYTEGIIEGRRQMLNCYPGLEKAWKEYRGDGTYWEFACKWFETIPALKLPAIKAQGDKS